MLDNAWLIPLPPRGLVRRSSCSSASGCRGKGAEIGIAAVGASFVLSCVAAVQWIDRVDDAPGTAERAARPSAARAPWREGGEHAVGRAGRHTASRGGRTAASSSTSAPTIDGLAVMMLFVVTLDLAARARLLDRLHARRPALHPLLRRAEPVHRVDARCSSSPTTRSQLLVGWELVGLCSFMLIGHWWEEKPNSDAAIKAFLTTRTGDVGLMIGIIVLFFAAGHVQHRRRSTSTRSSGEIGHDAAARRRRAAC